MLHASDIIKHSLLSIGELTEEAAEARIKYIKKFRLQHTRKISRLASNTDLINRLFLSSDPLITGKRKIYYIQKTALLESTISLLDETI